MAEEIVFKTTVDTGNSVSAINDVDKALKEVNSTVKSNSVDSNKAFDDLNAKVDSGELSVRQLSKAVKEYATIAVQAGEDSPIGQEAIRRAGELKDRLGDLQTQINNNANDGRSMQTALQLGQGIAAGYAVAQGALALFGDENKDLQKTLVKLQAIQAVLAGLEEIRSILEKESLVRTAALKVWNVVKVASEYAYATAIGTSTGALKLARLAMLALPIVAIIAGIIAIGSAMSAFGDETESTEEKQKRLDDALEATNKTLESQKLAYENAATASKWANDKQLIDALNAGASEKEINDIKLKGSKNRLAILKAEYEKNKENALVMYSDLKITQAQVDAIMKSKSDSYKKYSTELMNMNMAEAQSRNESIRATRKSQNEDNKKQAEASIEHNKKVKEAAIKHKQDLAKVEEDNRVAMHNSEVGFFEATILSNQELSKKAFNAQKGLLLENKEFALADLKATEGQKEAIKAKYNADLIKLEKEHNDALKEIVYKDKKAILEVALNDDTKNVEAKKDLLLLERDFLLSNTKLTEAEIFAIKQNYIKEVQDMDSEAYTAYQEATNTAQQNEINGVNEKYDALIKTAEQYGFDTIELEKKRQEELNKIEEAATVKKIDNVKKYADATMASLNALNDLQNQLDANKLKNQNLTEAQVLEIKKKAFNRDKALKIASVSINTAEAISKSVAASPLTFGAPFSVFSAVTGIAQIAAIASTKFDGGGSNITAPTTPANENQSSGGGGFGVGSTSEVSSVGLTDNATGIKVTVVDSEIKAVMDASAAASVLSTFGG
jgi:hypothetical protein